MNLKQFMKSLVILLFCSLSFLTLMAMPGCKKLSDDATENGGANTTDTSGITYLALGDSYTIGESVTMEERFPHITSALLQKEGINITGLQYIATTGWTTANLQSAIASKNLQNTFDVVSLLIGVNDQYQGLDTAGYRLRFSQLLEKAIQLTGNRKSRVFVLSIPDYPIIVLRLLCRLPVKTGCIPK
jgi:lysophospholipase L1-like esterase